LDIKAVIFDYGQVISLPLDPMAVDRLAKRARVPTDIFEPMLWSLRDEFDRGTVSGKDYYKDLLSRLGAGMDDAGIEEILAMDFDNWKNIDGETVSLMEDLKKAGYTLGILSNMPGDFRGWAQENIPAFALADVGVFSCDVKSIKPEEPIYRKLLEMLESRISNLHASQVVFFDDKPENIEGARALGIEGFVWKNAANARRELAELGVNL